MQIIKKILALMLVAFCSAQSVVHAKKMVVNVPVLDVRYEPLADLSFKPSYPMLSRISGKLETQLLYGDEVTVLDVSDPVWATIETPQMYCDTAKNYELKPLWGYVLQKGLMTPPQEYQENATVSVLWAPVHQEPQADSPIVITFSYGTRVYVTEQIDSSWFKIRFLDGTYH